MSFSDLWTVHTQMFFEVKTMQIFINVTLCVSTIMKFTYCLLTKKDFFVTKKDSLVRESGKKFCRFLE